MHKTLFALSLGFGLCILAAAAQANPTTRCADRDAIVQKLEKKYGETRQSVGLSRNQGMVETFASSETGTWTILFSSPDGQSCLVAAGDNYQAMSGQIVRSSKDT